MSNEFKKVDFGRRSDGVGIQSGGEVFLGDVYYGRIDNTGRIIPAKYGDPTLAINDFGYVVGCYDGKTYGKIHTIGMSTYLELFEQDDSDVVSDNSGKILESISNRYETFANTPKKSGYSNSFGKKGKIGAFIFLALFIIYSIVCFIIDSPF